MIMNKARKQFILSKEDIQRFRLSRLDFKKTKTTTKQNIVNLVNQEKG